MIAKGAGTSSRELTHADYRRLADLRYLLRQFLAFSESAAEATGLPSHQHQALLAIKGFPDDTEVTVGALADRLGIKHNSAVGLIDRLAKAGLVRRERDANDRRRVSVALTPKAERLLARLTRVHRDQLKRLAPTFRRLLEEL